MNSIYLTILLDGWNSHRYAYLSEPGFTWTNILNRPTGAQSSHSPLFYYLHYLDDQYAFALIDDQRTLILQTMALMAWLMIGAAVFPTVTGNYLNCRVVIHIVTVT